jgi:hypothetical protein
MPAAGNPCCSVSQVYDALYVPWQGVETGTDVADAASRGLNTLRKKVVSLSLLH